MTLTLLLDGEAAGLAAVELAPKSSAVAPPSAPGLPVSVPVIAESTRQSNEQMAGIPWPVFAPALPIAEPSTRVVEERPVPCGLFSAPIDPIADPKPAARKLFRPQWRLSVAPPRTQALGPMLSDG